MCVLVTNSAVHGGRSENSFNGLLLNLFWWIRVGYYSHLFQVFQVLIMQCTNSSVTWSWVAGISREILVYVSRKSYSAPSMSICNRKGRTLKTVIDNGHKLPHLARPSPQKWTTHIVTDSFTQQISIYPGKLRQPPPRVSSIPVNNFA